MAKSKAKSAKSAKPAKRAKADNAAPLVDLTPEEVSQLARPRDGFEAHAPKLLAMYAKYGDELRIKSLDPAKVSAALHSWSALDDVEQSAAKHLEMVRETRAQHASNIWRAMMDIYARADASGRTNADIARAVSDFRAFMSTGPRAKKKSPTP